MLRHVLIPAALFTLAVSSVARSSTVVEGRYYPGSERIGSLPVDLNSDSTPDLSVVAGPYGYVGTIRGSFVKIMSSSIYVVAQTVGPNPLNSGGTAAIPLNAGDVVGPSSTFGATPGAFIYDDNEIVDALPLGLPGWDTPHYA